MLQGYIALPAVFAVYLYAATPTLRKRILNLALAGVALTVSSFWWATAVSLVPADDRPYIGGSTDGTAWDLITGYNGLGRVLGGEGNGGGGGGGGGGFSGTASLGRLFNDILGGQISWLIPFSAVALVGGLVLCGRAPRTDLTRAALVLWGGWMLLHYLTFAMAEGTMHPYYTTAVAPGIAVLCGGGGVMLLRAFRGGDARWSWVLPAGFAVTGVWAVVLLRRATDWNAWLWPAVAVVMVLAIVGLVLFRTGSTRPAAGRVRDRRDRRGPRGSDGVRGRRSGEYGRRHGRHQPDRRSVDRQRIRRRWRSGRLRRQRRRAGRWRAARRHPAGRPGDRPGRRSDDARRRCER